MKLPAVAIFAAFACGIVLGLCLPFTRYAPSHNFLIGGFILAGCLILGGMVLAAAGWLRSAVAASLLCWVLLGASSARIADRPLPPNHVVILVNDGRLDLHTALRWYGKLRDEPTKLPWGYGYEVELHDVDYRSARLPVEGGMRVSFSPHPDEPLLSELHAGDDVSILTQAKRPQVFKDEGAFDRRTYLAAHGIDLVATLRAPELIQCVSAGQLTPASALARAPKAARRSGHVVRRATTSRRRTSRDAAGRPEFRGPRRSRGYRIPGPPLWLVIVFFLLLGLLVVTLRAEWSWKRRAFLTLCAALALCSVAIAIFPFSPKSSPGKLEVTILDVGQGDSLFVVSPHGKTLLIDGGGSFGGFVGRPERYGIDPGEEAVSPYLWSRGYQGIDVVALTHAHQDHVGGLIAVLQNFRVGTLWLGREATSPPLAALEKLAREKHIPIERQRRGNSFQWDDVQGQFFWPQTPGEENAAAAKNNDSLVLRLQYGHRAILLPGDAEKDAEREMMAENEETNLSADVLKVGHHGGKNSTTPEFLAAVKPRVAVISVGQDNSYGHPSPELLERLGGSGVRVLRTDREGAVQLLTDGERIEISCFVACPQLSLEQAAKDSGRAQTPDGEKKSQQQ